MLVWKNPVVVRIKTVRQQAGSGFVNCTVDERVVIIKFDD